MGLFTSGFEKAMYRELFYSTFSGYTSISQGTLSNLIFDFCASIAHNKLIFPAGVSKRNQERTLYSSYAMGTQLAGMFAPETETKEATSAAIKGFSISCINKFKINFITFLKFISFETNSFLKFSL